MTHTRLRVDEFLLGDEPRDLWLEQLGGTVGDLTMTVSGDALVEPGQDLVLFLRITSAASGWAAIWRGWCCSCRSTASSPPSSTNPSLRSR